jgi:hypothetical protein
MAILLILIISLLVSLDPNVSDPGMLTWLGANLSWSYILLFFATFAALILEGVNLASDKKAAKSALIGIGFLGGIILISYLFADSEMPKFFGADKFIENKTVTPSSLRWIGAGLIATYILSAISVVAIIWSSIKNVFS